MPALLAIASVTASMAVTLHVVLHKQDTRSAVGWLGLAWLAPLVGAVLYVMLGVNRIERRAFRLRLGQDRRPALEGPIPHPVEGGGRPLSDFVERVSGRRPIGGNTASLLEDGDQGFPAMLAAIDGANHRVSLGTYIFDVDRSGRAFIEALARARGRGVSVRVLIDGLGARYSWPTAIDRLRAVGVPTGVFLWSLKPWETPYLNLRNHRKLLVVDGAVAFVGGLNIRDAHVVARARRPARDLVVRVEGPAACAVEEVFAVDWRMATGEVFAAMEEAPAAGGEAVTVLPDGPDEDFAVARWTLVGALACASTEVLILTPYFLPGPDVLRALETAALRGVRVSIAIPERSNLPWVDWAARVELPGLIRRGVDVRIAPAPFDHSKLMVVDGRWALLGSANWDERSLRLNFELNLAVSEGAFARSAHALARARMARALPVTEAELAAAPGWQHLRNRAVRLLKPYL